jgi:hypothetical protein
MGAAALVLACDQSHDPCFTPQSVVNDLRVLAISVDPPDPVVDLASGIVEPVRLRALIVRETGSSGIFDVSWSLCVAGTNPGCPAGTVVMTDHEWSDESSVEMTVPAELVAAARAADPLHGFGGIRVLAALHVSGARPADATTPILFSEQAAAVRNHPPSMQGLRFTPAGQEMQDAPAEPLPMELTVGDPTGLRPVLAPGAMEEYDTVDLAGHPVHLQERVRYSFYATPGLAIGRLLATSIGPGQVVFFPSGSDVEADEPPPGTPDTPAGLMNMEAVQRGGVQGTLWIVARDSRGACSWLEVMVSAIERDPDCSGPPPLRNCAQLDFGCF